MDNTHMKRLLLVIILAGLVPSALARTIAIEVHGMTCAFCVENLQHKFSQMPSVLKVDVSLKYKKVRLQTLEDAPSLQAIKQTVLDAGFTPVAIKELDDEF
mgnify:CR=1 FL=1